MCVHMQWLICISVFFFPSSVACTAFIILLGFFWHLFFFSIRLISACTTGFSFCNNTEGMCTHTHKQDQTGSQHPSGCFLRAPLRILQLVFIFFSMLPRPPFLQQASIAPVIQEDTHSSLKRKGNLTNAHTSFFLIHTWKNPRGLPDSHLRD